LYHHFGNVALSFFLPNVRNVVKSQGWNEKEDCPVTAGEEALDKVLKPYMEDSRMNMMFDFSNMEASEVRDDIQHQSLHPKKNGKPNNCPHDNMQLASATKLQPAVQPLWKSRSKHTTMLYLLVVAKHSLLTITMMVALVSPAIDKRFIAVTI
jgi:hypothetical protein